MNAAPQILMIHPPVASPFYPPWEPAQRLAALSALGLPALFYDANLDFLRKFLLSPAHPDNFWRQPSRFYDPEPYPAAVTELDRQLEPTRTGDSAKRLFRAFCQAHWETKTDIPGLQSIILSLSSPAQVLAAATLARYSQKEHPQVGVILWGAPSLLKAARSQIDQAVLAPDLKTLVGALGAKTEDVPRVESIWPDFSRLPLTGYLCPELVLPLRLPWPGSNPPAGTLSLPEYAQNVRQQIDVAGFLSQDARIDCKQALSLGQTADKEGAPLAIGLLCSDPKSVSPDDAGKLYEIGIRHITWQNLQADPKGVAKALEPFSKAGIWNHIGFGLQKSPDAGLARLCASNPNILHSWETPRSGYTLLYKRRSDPEVYGEVAPLPGVPFWHYLADPACRLFYLRRHGPEEIKRWRINGSPPALYQLGRQITYHYAQPQKLPPGYMDEICRMVAAGGSVALKWVRHNLEHAFLIGYAEEHGVIVGNSSLKRPRSEYITAVSIQTGLDLTGFLERGYTSVRPEYRGQGIGTALLAGLTARIGDRKLFSVISSNNKGAQKMALRNNTQLVATFYSERVQKELGIWIPASMR